jgi:hypothetical protein
MEEVLALEVPIALGVACFDRGCVDGGLHSRVRVAGFITGQAPGDFGEMTLNVGDHHVLDLELGDRVNWVNAPSG